MGEGFKEASWKLAITCAGKSLTPMKDVKFLDQGDQ